MLQHARALKILSAERINKGTVLIFIFGLPSKPKNLAAPTSPLYLISILFSAAGVAQVIALIFAIVNNDHIIVYSLPPL